ncbi:sensor histidine kinase [Fundidesulfovibrio terrae]|uniref:sensor histidine kinase n=1 Tax=Fundidesulfovibrio terrae TaxID=2922866 RepID=UPI001FAF827B|nr:histidine kinase dimerization/phosphoacceptor domain -containing protein [Fundidesulfovibrio terrae]
MVTPNVVSIRACLIGLIVLSTLPALGIIWHIGAGQRDAALENARQGALNLTAGFAYVQKDMTAAVQSLTETLAEMPEVREGDMAACTSLFKSLLEKHPEYANILAVSPAGDVLASALPAMRVNVADRAHIREALSHKSFSAGEYMVSRMAFEPVFPYACPVLGPDGHVRLVLVATLRLTSYARLLAELSLPKGSVVSVVDRSGRRLFHSPDKPDTNPLGGLIRPEALSRISGPDEQGTFETTSSDGVRMIFAFKRLRLAPDQPPYAAIMVGLPEAAVLSAAYREQSTSLALMTVAAILAMAAALGLGERTVVRPITRITAAAGKIARGDLGARAGRGYAPRELAGLAGTFDSMAQSLEKRARDRETIHSALRASRRRFKDIVSKLSDWIWELDARGRFTLSSGRVEEIIGYQPWEMRGRHFREFLIPGERERIQALFEMSSAALAPIRDVEAWHQARGGGQVCLRTNATVLLDAEGRFAGYRGVCMDVTAQRTYEEQLVRSLREKELLLKEIHHRVKNNLQIISSLLSLESRDFLASPQVEQAFEDMRGRVRSIALIHELLYTAENFSAVNMAQYLSSLCGTLASTLALPGQRVDFSCQGPALLLPLDRAMPLALLANELTTNALKHAFDGGSGEVRVALEGAYGQGRLLVEDDGRGISPDVKKGERHGLGMELIMALADQLGGAVDFPERTRGTAVLITFPLPTPP